MKELHPLPGQMWRVTGPARHAIYLHSGWWNILVESCGEYTLTDTRAPVPLELAAIQPAGPTWAEQFDALAAVSGLKTTWAREILRYRAQGLAAADSVTR